MKCKTNYVNRVKIYYVKYIASIINLIDKKKRKIVFSIIPIILFYREKWQRNCT